MWVEKRLDSNRLRGEIVGAFLGDQLGVPVPDFAVMVEDEKPTVWFSRYMDTAQHWDGSRAETLANYESVARMLVLDAIIGNQDRHAQNILLQPVDWPKNGKHYTLWCIDHEDSLAGKPMELAGLGVRIPRVDRLPGDLSVEGLENELAATAHRASRVSPRLLASIARDASRAAGDGEQELQEALATRCAAASQIVQDYVTSIRRQRRQ